MEVVFGPNSIDEPSLLYKFQRKIKVFNTNQPLPNRGYNLVTCTSKYGFVFVATPLRTLSVYYLKELIDKETEPQHLSLNLQVSPTHISVNCNEEWLAVVGGQMLLVYKCLDFQNAEVRPSVTIKCDVNPSTFVSSLQWNPCIPDTIGIVYFDGTLLVSQVSTIQLKKIQSKARCICWSPKGKQLVTGNHDGTLSQYKPDLSPMKMVPAPNLFEGAPVEVLAIYWIATYQFAVTYKNSTDNSRPAVAIVNTPKGGQSVCYNFEDICYSMGSNRPWYYYLQGLAQWNLVLSSSSNSMEIATLASPDGANWVQWCQPDEARPELPLTDKKQENYPVGVCFDTAAVHQLPWGENETLPPMPLLHVVSQTGMLSVFNLINLNKSAPQVCAQPQHLILPAAALTRVLPDDSPPQPEALTAVPQSQPPPQYQQTTQPPQVLQPLQLAPVQPTPVQATPVLPTPVQPTPVHPTPMQPTLVQPTPVQPSNFATPTTASLSFGVKMEPAPTTATEVVNPVSQSKPTVPAPKAQATAYEVAAALAEQEKIDKAKMNQKLRNMLIKEVNVFNLEMYNFMKLTQEKQVKLQKDIESTDINTDVEVDAERFRKECDIDDLRESIIQLKLEMVRACAVIAEARTQAEAKDLQEWTQADPLTMKRISSVKKLAYYVQTQLEHARKALDLRWNEMSARDQYTKSGEHMIRPILDDVYQPLVKQQEILSRQMAVLKTLRSTMNECNFEPTFKSTSLLRSTPFRNKDPLSKLTKNILNMSIEPQSKSKDNLLSSQKLDALRDVLSNHRPIKIKPVNVELRQHLNAMKQRYEIEKEMREAEIKQETEPGQTQPQMNTMTIKQPVQIPQSKIEKPKVEQPIQISLTKIEQPVQAPTAKVELPLQQDTQRKDSNVFTGQKFGASAAFTFTQPSVFGSVPKPDIVKESPITIPTYNPVNLKPGNQPTNVARTLFTDEKEDQKQGLQEPQSQHVEDQPKQFQPNINSYTKNQLRKFILKDSSNENLPQTNEPKNDANTFMGQNICSPTAFAFSKLASPSTTSIFGSKPVSDVNTAFNKYNPKSSETGEPDTVPINDENMPREEKAAKPVTNMFSMKSSIQFGGKNQNVPDVLKSGQTFAFGKTDIKDNNSTTPVEGTEKTDVPEKSTDRQEKQTADVKKENEIKPVQQAANKPTAQSVIYVDLKKPAAEAKVEKVPPSVFDVSTAPANTGTKLQFDIGPMTTQQSSVLEKTNQSVPLESLSKTNTETTVTKEKVKMTPITPADILSTISTDATPTILTTTSIPTSQAVESKLQTDTNSAKDSPNATTTNVFSSATADSVFTTTNTTTPAFGVEGTKDTKPSIFGTPTSGFGSTQPSAFASNASSIFASASASAFGTQTTKASIFTPDTTSQSTGIFGTSPTTSASIFGNASSAQSIFNAASTSMFGGTPTTSQNIFGTPSQSVFGSAGSPSQVFVTPTTQTSIFGTPSQTSQPSIFGSPTQTSQATSVFGTPPSATQGSVFGTPTTTQSSLFGGAESNLFASATISTTSAPTQAGGNIFGGGSPASVFGNNNNVFGKTSFSGSNPTTANIFGGASSFKQEPATDFWGGSSNTGGFGTSSFGQPATTQASIFGSSGGGFSTPSPGQPFGSPQGPFSGGDAKTSVFGTPQQQPGSAFGGSPVFGSKPVFGGSPTYGSTAFGGFNKSPNSGFGAPAAFGGGSSFGSTSPGKAFGNAAPSFGSPTQSNATFENLATQNTLTFGNLAQQSGQAPQSSPAQQSPSFSGWRG